MEWTRSRRRRHGRRWERLVACAVFVAVAVRAGTGTNPEELIAAAHAGCFSMALAAVLQQAGDLPESIDTRAEVKLEKQNDGFEITSISNAQLALARKQKPGETATALPEVCLKGTGGLLSGQRGGRAHGRVAFEHVTNCDASLTCWSAALAQQKVKRRAVEGLGVLVQPGVRQVVEDHPFASADAAADRSANRANTRGHELQR
jgi:organic hydroperoxide reductase OsmC/OhrA